MDTITLADLKALFDTRKGAQIVTLVTHTAPNMRKTNNPFYGRVIKVSKVNGVVNFNYANSVERQRLREDHPEPEFTPEPRAWGVHIPHTPFIEHKGETYLEMKVERSVEAPEYFIDGEPANAEQVAAMKEFITKGKQALTQETEKEVIVRDYKVSNLRAIKIGGELLTLVSNQD